MGKAKSKKLLEMVKTGIPTNPGLGEDWGFGGLVTFGAFHMVVPSFEERREMLGEARSGHTAESPPDDSHVMLAQARVVERHRDMSDFSTELISESESIA